jgi:hypothetical protein
VALAQAVDHDEVRQLGDQRRERRERVLRAEVAEALVDDHLTHAALHPLDEGDEPVVRDQPSVGVVGVDDHDRVGRVALDQRRQLVEVDAEVLARVELVRDDGARGELVVRRERRQAPAAAGPARGRAAPGSPRTRRSPRRADRTARPREGRAATRSRPPATGSATPSARAAPAGSRAAAPSQRRSRTGSRGSTRRSRRGRGARAPARRRWASGSRSRPSATAATWPRRARPASARRSPRAAPARRSGRAHGSGHRRGRGRSCTGRSRTSWA